MFDTEEPDYQTLDRVLEQLRGYLTGLVRLTENARLGDLFAVEAQNWVAMGQKAGRNRHNPSFAKDAITRFFDAGLADARFLLDQCMRTNTEWAKTSTIRRDAELSGLKKEADRRAAAANRGNPDSPIAKEYRQLDEYQCQLDVAQGLSRLWTPADFSAVAAGKAAAEHALFVEEVEESRTKWTKDLLTDYQTRMKTVVGRLNAIASELAVIEPAKTDVKAHLERERDELQRAIANAPEHAALEGLRKLAEAAGLPSGRAASAETQQARPPKWWKFRVPGYRRVLWASFVVAFFGEQMLMQQLTGTYLELRMIPLVLNIDVPNHLKAFGNATTTMAELGAVSQLFGDAVNFLLAFVFGCIPLLLSFPVRYYLDRQDETKQEPTNVTRTFTVAVFLLLLSLGLVAAIQSTVLAPFGSLIKGIALPTFTLVLTLSTGWIMHLLFTEGSRHHFHDFLRSGEIARLTASVDGCRGRINALEEQAAVAQRKLVAAQHRHAGEDGFIAGMADGQSLPATIFEKAKLAAIAAFDSGYEAGVRARTQGIEIKEGEQDGRTFDELLAHLARHRMLDILEPATDLVADRIDKTKFDNVYAAGLALVNAVASSTSTVGQIDRLVQGFQTEVANAKDRATTPLERSLANQYALAQLQFENGLAQANPLQRNDIWAKATAMVGEANKVYLEKS